MAVNDLLKGETSIEEQVNRIAAARGTAEPQAPTEEPKAEEVAEDAAPEVEYEEAEETEEVEEAEEYEADEESEESDDSDGPYYYQIGDEEVTEDEIVEWKQGYMRHKDYTQKTMATAEQSKALKAHTEKLQETAETMAGHIQMMQEAFTKEFQNIDWDDLRDNDITEYTKLKEKREERTAQLQNARNTYLSAIQQQQQALVEQEMPKMRDVFPSWFDQEKGKDIKKADMELMSNFLEKEGFSDDEVGKILRARDWAIIYKAAKYDAAQNKSSLSAKKVRKTPKMAKPRRSTTTIDKQIKAAQAKLKQTGSEKDALELRKLKRQMRQTKNGATNQYL